MKKPQEICTIIGSSLGFIGSLLIIIFYLLFNQLYFLYRKLIFILSVYDLIQSISYLLPGHSNRIFCRIQFELITGFATCAQFWSASISFISFLKVVKEFDDKKLNKIQKFLHVAMWFISITFILLSFFVGNPEESTTYWCMSTEKPIIIPLYSVNWVYIIACFIFYIFTIIKIRKIIKLNSQGNYGPKTSQMSQVWIQFRLSLIPLIYILIFIPATIRRIRTLINPSANDIFSVDIIHSLFASTQGFWDFWIFVVFDLEMRKKIGNCFSCYSKNRQNAAQLDIEDYKNLRNETFTFSKDLLNSKESERKSLIQNDELEKN
ncbi:g-protein coupled receptor 1 [Anaeramoeba ignava]|uniref:G-protein coupled receptor 1 n=1 Tax=Anaeramoeba ignava TaxID=1746090 RepID=A0A9Q0RHE0_ANAIG|nr:g-protein coupled receptor 1 [Anaeramoeba ignava]